MDTKFFDSIFEGDSTNGIQLGMGLTNGDFWPRPNGCQNLYCGSSFYTMDFDNIVLVIATSEEIFNISSFNPEPCETYLYVLRRVNCCGEEEQSLTAALKVEFDSLDNLIEPCCNKILSVSVEQFEGQRVRLVWYYCPIDQQAECDSFNVYWDDGCGEVDFETVISTEDYVGPGLYFYETGVLTGGEYIFCVKAISETDVMNGLTGRVKIQFRDLAPDSIGMLFSRAF